MHVLSLRVREARRQEDYENDPVPELEHQVFEPGDEMHHPIAGRLRDLLPHPGASTQPDGGGASPI